MKKWEYKGVTLRAEKKTEKGESMQAMGEQGWELVAVVNMSDEEAQQLVFYYKREKI